MDDLSNTAVHFAEVTVVVFLILVCDYMLFMCPPPERSVWKNTLIQMLHHHCSNFIRDCCVTSILLIILDELAIITFYSVMTQVQGIVWVILTS